MKLSIMFEIDVANYSKPPPGKINCRKNENNMVTFDGCCDGPRPHRGQPQRRQA